MLWTLALLAGSVLALAGCASHAGTMSGVRDALLNNDLDEARARLAEAGRGTDDLLFALEDGLLLHYAGDPELSNLRFEFVEFRVDELYTKSISRAGLSLITSDLVLRFEPRGIDNFLVNYYRALNYLELWEPGEAWVEWRKLALKLQFSRDQGTAPYLDPPFFNQLVGLGLEWDDPGSGYVSLRLAEAGYLEQGMAPPPDLVLDLMRLAAALGFADHLDVYRDRYGSQAVGSLSVQPEPFPPGEIVLLVEEGLVAPIDEVSIYIPITEERAAESDRGARVDLAESLAHEYETGRYQGVTRSYAGKRGIAYILPMSFPVFGLGEVAFDRLAAVVGSDTVAARVVLHVSDLQEMAFEDRRLGIYVKTIARALIKYAAAAKLEEEAEEEGGETAGDIVGILANVVNVATERADTRAWLGLPTRIWMTRLRVRPGQHEIRLLIDGREAETLGPVDVRPGERRFITHRIF